MGGIITTRRCKSCGWEQTRGRHYPESAPLAIGVIAFLFLYPKIDWDALFSGEPGMWDAGMAMIFLLLALIVPSWELGRVLLANWRDRWPFNENCPRCGGGNFDDGGGLY
ncbi:MAG: hypothetical protein OEV92_11060 [Nitrospinota bacterium]|nr:hypothetical protein [Nitrospinota bacterium]